MSDRTCAHPGCDSQLPSRYGKPGRPRKYCDAHRSSRTSQDSLTKVCELDGCDRMVRARGLCAPHYNRKHQPNRHRPRKVPCFACGLPAMKTGYGERRTVCSYRCRAFLTHGKWPHEGKELVGPVERRPRSEFWPAPVTALPSLRRFFIQGRCEWCLSDFTRCLPLGGTPARYCDPKCATRAGRARQRSREGRFWIPDARRMAIYERDNWTCQLCLEPTSREYSHDDPWSPTLDHIEPQSHALIPDHSDANLRLCHAWCNAVRGDETYYSAADLAA